MDEKIGAQLKRIRKKNNTTLQELSQMSGLSISYISLLERGLNSPTIENLNKLCKALNITLTGLLTNLNTAPLLVRKHERRVIFHEPGGLRYEAISEGNRNMKGICIIVADDKIHRTESHIADELGYVVSGSLEVDVDGNIFEMHPGDTVYIPANTEHSYKKISEEDCTTIWIYHNIAKDSYISHVHEQE